MTARTARDALLAVLDDAAAGAAARIEIAAALARALQRPLALVQVENPIALQAAALASTRALPHAGADWSPYTPGDVERGWRAQAARLRALAPAIARRHEVSWTLRTLRAPWPQAALGLIEDHAWLLLGPAPPRARAGAATVLLLDDGSAAAAHALPAAQRLAQALSATLRVLRWTDGDEAGLRRLWHGAALCLLPRGQATPQRLLDPPCPLLLVDDPDDG